MRARGLLATALVVALAAGCGQDPTPADSVPALARDLDRVDAAIAAGEYDAARSALAQLRDRAGRLDADQEQDVLTAADALEQQLPAATEPPEPQESTSPTPSVTSTPAAPEPHAEPKPKPPKPKGHEKKPKKPKPHGPGPR